MTNDGILRVSRWLHALRFRISRSLARRFQDARLLAGRRPSGLQLAALVMAAGAGTASAHDPISTNLTYSKEISRLLARRCISCHRGGGRAPMPLTSFEEVRPWAIAIKEEVLARRMPPWGAVKGFGQFSPDGSLTENEILLVAAWVEGGAPQGDMIWLQKSNLVQERATSSPELNRGDLRKATRIRVQKGHLNLPAAVNLVGLAPRVTGILESVRVVARLPNGNVLPLLWLYQYGPGSNGAFLSAQSMTLPAGTQIESSSPVEFDLITLNKAGPDGAPPATKIAPAR